MKINAQRKQKQTLSFNSILTIEKWPIGLNYLEVHKNITNTKNHKRKDYTFSPHFFDDITTNNKLE